MGAVQDGVGAGVGQHRIFLGPYLPLQEVVETNTENAGFVCVYAQARALLMRAVSGDIPPPSASQVGSKYSLTRYTDYCTIDKCKIIL